MPVYDLGNKNKYYTLYSLIRGDILAGKLKAGEKLWGKRTLAHDLSISVITVQNAYEQLLAEGYITSRERSGYFVAKVNTERAAKADKRTEEVAVEPKKIYKWDLTSGRAPARLFPFSVWAKLMRSTLSEEGEHLLERVPCEGNLRLREAISAYLYRSRGVTAEPERIIIGAGAEYLYGVIVQLLGRDKPYAVENPGYGRISRSYALNGAECVYISVGESGADAAEVEKSGACALHISPSHQYPTGAVMPASVRSRLIRWAEENDAYIIEDDYDSEFRLAGKPLQAMVSLDGDRVIYMNTFSKTLAPSLRMGYAVLPEKLCEKFRKMYSLTANVVPLFEQKTLSKMLDGGYFERHVNRLKNYYRGVRAKLLEEIKKLPFEKQIVETGGGLHITLRLPTFASDGDIKKYAEERGIKIMCLTDYLAAPAEGYGGVAIINYSGIDIHTSQQNRP